MTATELFAGNGDDHFQVQEHFDCTQDELWAAITDPDRLSAWLGGNCRVERRVGGEVRFDLPADGIVANGVVRAFSPPKEGFTVAHLEHTFIDEAKPDVLSTCTWAVVRLDEGSDLYLTMDGLVVDDAGANPFAAISNSLRSAVDDTEASPPLSVDEARALYRAAHTVLLVDWLGPETPATIAATAPVVFGKVGPKPDDWASVEPDGDGFKTTRIPRPDHADLLHLDWTLGFDEFVEVAVQLGAKTFWYHSGRTSPLDPTDRPGCWVPPRQSARQRRIVEAAGMTYVDAHSIVAIARS
jgi:uncharacterized protein YndB with AHSA1/START domain